ncbi:MAG TPA: PilZ domain-containing protein [Synergistaceae bacterium]|nr:PilZ domain-containing protein [Synergistaceae bacterium]HQF91251.1 PilZ domain-containing protein [Synergistaceae bacterium]HQH77643.1 PilZ domain-containing protein [Synergistaceae bacterium]HQK24866.1 PilZ domain-containing protein [Synergistaceae bacterium]
MELDGAKIESLLKPRVGERAEIRIDAGLHKGQFPSILESVEGLVLGLGHPLRKGGLLPVYRDMALGVYLEDERLPLLVRGVALRSDLTAHVPLLWVRVVEDVERMQRRRYLRVTAVMPVQFWLMEQGESVHLSGRWREGTVLDLSLGGMRLQYRGSRATHKDMLCLTLLPMGGKAFPVMGKIVWAPPQKEADLNEVGIEYVGVSRMLEKELGGFIRQQEMSGRT